MYTTSQSAWKESVMKNLICTFITCCLILSVCVATGYAQKRALDASEVSQLFLGNSVDIVGENIDKRTGEPWKYRAYASDLGVLLVVFESGARQTRSWSVSEDGAFCFGKPLERHKGGTTCGYIVPQEGGVYKMYKAKHLYHKDGKVVGGKQVKLLVTFSNFQKGNTTL